MKEWKNSLEKISQQPKRKLSIREKRDSSLFFSYFHIKYIKYFIDFFKKMDIMFYVKQFFGGLHA